MNARHASLVMIIAACLWGTHPVLIKLADWTPWGTAWVRGIFCAAVLLIYAHVTGGLSRKSLLVQCFCGLFLAINSGLFVGASTYTSPANAVVPLLLDFALLGKKPLLGDMGRLLLGLAGIVAIVSSGLHGDGGLGNVFALLAGVAIAAHIFLCQRLNARHMGNREVLTAMLIGWLLTAVVLAPTGFALPLPSGNALVFLGLFGVLSAIPWLLWGKAIAYIPGHVVAALLSVEACVAAVMGWWILGEAPGPVAAIGGGLTLLAATLQVRAGAREGS